MRYLTLVLVALFVATGSPLAAQEAPVEPGARVRVTAPAQQPGWVIGTVVAWEREQLVLEVERPDGLRGTQLRLARDQLTRLDVHRGRKRRTLLGAGIGGLVGAAAGVAIVAGICGGLDSDACTQGQVPIAGAIGGGGGLLIGAGIGTLIKTDRWKAFPVDRVRVSVTPVRNGRLALLVSVRVP